MRRERTFGKSSVYNVDNTFSCCNRLKSANRLLPNFYLTRSNMRLAKAAPWVVPVESKLPLPSYVLYATAFENEEILSWPCVRKASLSSSTSLTRNSSRKTMCLFRRVPRSCVRGLSVPALLLWPLVSPFYSHTLLFCFHSLQSVPDVSSCDPVLCSLHLLPNTLNVYD